jgi:hypothetical protein
MARLLRAMGWQQRGRQSRAEKGGGRPRPGWGGGGGEDLPRGVRREVLRPPGAGDAVRTRRRRGRDEDDGATATTMVTR